MTVYADILFIVNLYIDAMLICAVRSFLRLPLSVFRLFMTSMLGGLFGLTALLPRLHGAALIGISLVQAFLIICSAFAPKPPKLLLKATFLLMLFSAALSGFFGMMQLFVPKDRMLLRNGSVYFDLSPLTLVLFTCIAYAALLILERLFSSREPSAFFSTIELTLGGNSVVIPAKLDTGLTLSEPFSGLPVIIAERAAVAELLPKDFGTTESSLPMRLIPYGTIAGNGLLPAFKPDKAVINCSTVECWVSVTEKPLSSGTYNALMGAQLCQNTIREELS